jgi:hypothetical protein
MLTSATYGYAAVLIGTSSNAGFTSLGSVEALALFAKRAGGAFFGLAYTSFIKASPPSPKASAPSASKLYVPLGSGLSSSPSGVVSIGPVFLFAPPIGISSKFA